MENRPSQMNLISFFALISCHESLVDEIDQFHHHQLNSVDEINGVDEKNPKIFQSIQLGTTHQLDLNSRTIQS